MKVYSSDSSLIQGQKIKKGNQFIHVIKPCRLDEGIISLSDLNLEVQLEGDLTWFIPASGSGSRMFQLLHDYLNDLIVSRELEIFISNLNLFPFFDMLPDQLKSCSTHNQEQLLELIKFVLFENGLNFGSLPKGLIPFHRTHKGFTTSFQDQIEQGQLIFTGPTQFHFTIQENYQSQIEQNINESEKEKDSSVTFSYQSPETNSYVFDSQLNLAFDNHSSPLKRPSGHGALLRNLNEVQSDYILIKNIDNVQHLSKSKLTLNYWNDLIKLTQVIKNQLFELYKNPKLEVLLELNQKYHFTSKENLEMLVGDEQIQTFINRPIRVCGMVKNSGQPGGGPFWVEKNGVVSKQIVEKAQIAPTLSQQQIVEQSSHFNPVMIVASVKDYQGVKFNLTDFKDDESYFIVQKRHEGKDVQFIENPGLWNGSMAHWISVFVEIPAETFSPVKTVLDLLDESHQA